MRGDDDDKLSSPWFLVFYPFAMTSMFIIRRRIGQQCGIFFHRNARLTNQRPAATFSTNHDVRPRIATPIRSFSTRSSAKTTSQHRHRQNKPKLKIEERTAILQADSQKFLNALASSSSSATHRYPTRDLQRLLLDWSKQLKPLGKNKELIIPAAETVNLLVHQLLDILASSDDDTVGIFTSPSSRGTAVSATSLASVGIHYWAKVQSNHPTHGNAAQKAETILTRILSELREPHANQALLAAHSSVLDAWSKADGRRSSDKALEWLRRMQSFDSKVSPDLMCYNCVLNSFSDPSNVVAAQWLWDEMKENPSIQPDAFSYSIYMKVWRNAIRRTAVHQMEEAEAGEKVQGLLHELIERYANGKRPELMPNSHVYSIAMAMAPSPEKAQQLHDDLMRWYDKSGRSVSLQPGIQQFVTSMNRWSQANNPEMVEALLKQMQEMYEQGHHHLRPNHQCFVVVLGAWAKHGTHDSIARAQTILSRMEDLFLETTEPQYRMNSYGYNLVMKAISSSDRENRVDQIEEIIKHMTALAAEHSIKELLPDKVTYSTLMKALIRESRPGFAHRVNDILKTMEQRFLEERKASNAPDVVCYAIAMDAWEKSKDPEAAKRAHEVIGGMAEFAAKSGIKRLKPNAFCFNTLINIHAQNGKGEEAEKVLADMKKEFQRGNNLVCPDAATFTSCIDAWAASGDRGCMKRSQTLFETMMERYQAGQLDCKPTNRTFAAMMSCLAKSNEHEKARKAQDLCERYENIGGKHNLRTYNALILALSSETGDEKAKHDALGQSLAVFHRLKNVDNLEPDSITYNSLLHACSLLIADPHEQQEAIQDVFENCCKDGKVNELVLKTLSRVASPDFLNNLVSEDSTKAIRLESLPVEWTSHTSAA